MNFLAHLYLSCDNEDLLIGNMIADFIRNKEVPNYTASVQKVIQLHRQIDSYTDNHPIVRQGTHRLQPNHGKYAPVVIDVLYDHLLVKNWKRYSGETLESFSKDVYEILTRRMADLPEKLQKRLPGMIEGDWLVQYGTLSGLQFVFDGMQKRARFTAAFDRAPAHLMVDYDAYEGEFNQFFPEVIDFVEKHCAC